METPEIEKEFNLLHEPWIMVKTQSNKTLKCSILEVFQHAHEVQALAGELPTQDVAIMRLLLAIMHAAFVGYNVADAEDALALWQKLWNLKQFPYDTIASYLGQYEERFWLFHPQYPFYQVANFETTLNKFRAAKGKKAKDQENIKSVARLIGDLFQSAHAKRLFAGRNGEQQEVLSYDEAARWLLHLNGFDDDAAKNPTPKGVGYLGQLGLIYAQGNNLFETLMLNFVLLDNRNDLFEDNQAKAKAYWEKPVCNTVENLINQPNAQKDLLTMQSRRILLKREHDKVVGYLLTMGDYFDKDKVLLNEQMTVWKKDEKIGFVPKCYLEKNQPLGNPILEKQMWRDLASIITIGQGTNNNNLNPGIINWLTILQDNKIFSRKWIKMCVAGIHYKQKGAGWQVVDFLNDSLQFNGLLLKDLSKNWIRGIMEALEVTDTAMRGLGRLAVNLMAAEGNRIEKNKNRDLEPMAIKVREKGYHQLDAVFRQWLVVLDPQKDELQDKKVEWLQTVKKIIGAEGEKLVDNCSDKVLVGYIKKEKERDVNINAFGAFNEFKAGLVKLLG